MKKVHYILNCLVFLYRKIEYALFIIKITTTQTESSRKYCDESPYTAVESLYTANVLVLLQITILKAIFTHYQYSTGESFPEPEII